MNSLGSMQKCCAAGRRTLPALAIVVCAGAGGPDSKPSSVLVPPELSSRIDQFFVQIKQDPAAATKTGADVIRSLRRLSDSQSLQAGLARIEAVESLADQIIRSLKSAKQRTAVSLADELLGAEALRTPPSSPSPTPQRPRAAYLYQRYLPAFRDPIDTNALPNQLRQFVAACYNLYIDVKIREVESCGVAEYCARPENTELQFYLLMLPLLHKSDEAFSTADLAFLPEWMRSDDVLERVYEFCVWQIERPRTAACVATLREGLPGCRHAAVEVLKDSARLAFRQRRPSLGLALMGLAAEKVAGNTPKARELYRLAITLLTDAKAWPLAASQCKVYLETFTELPDDERAAVVVSRLKALSEAKSTASLAVELEQAIVDRRIAGHMPELLLLKWRLLRQEGKGEEAAQVLKRFLKEYPNDTRAAEMYYAVAVDCLASQRYEESRSVFEALRERFPQSREAGQARQMLQRLSAIGTATRATRSKQ